MRDDFNNPASPLHQQTVELTQFLRRDRDCIELPYVLRYLDAGVPADSVVINKETFLTIAAFWGHTEVARELIARGTPIDWQNIHGDTALTYALAHGRRDITGMLLDAGASVVLCSGPDPRSTLQLAAKQGWSDVEERIKALMDVQLTAETMTLKGDVKPLKALRLKRQP